MARVNKSLDASGIIGLVIDSLPPTQLSPAASTPRSTARVDSTVCNTMRKRVSLFALMLAALTTNFALAQNTEQHSKRSVKGQVLSSDSLPPLRIKFKKSFKFIGSQSFVLYDRAQVEQFFFVEGDVRGQIKRMYMVQFEGSLPNAKVTYDYPATGTITLGKESYVVNAEVISNVPAALKQDSQSDIARAGSFLENRRLRLAEEITFQRFVRVVDEAKQNEIILVYVEAGNALGSTEKEKMLQQFSERSVKGLKVSK